MKATKGNMIKFMIMTNRKRLKGKSTQSTKQTVHGNER